MKKGLFLLAIAATLISCEKECGCLEPVKAWPETRERYTPDGYYLRTDVIYFGKWRDMCGNTKTRNISIANYTKWPDVEPICE
jgi:hypothetical protein